MDPDTALANARIHAAEVNCWLDNPDDERSFTLEDAAQGLSDAFMALDRWLSQAGVPPAEWLKGRDDGEVIDVSVTGDQLMRMLLGSDMPSGIVIVSLDE